MPNGAPGHGLKILATGRTSDELRDICHSRGVEIYDGAKTARYFTIGGDALEGYREIREARRGIFSVQSLITEPLSLGISTRSITSIRGPAIGRSLCSRTSRLIADRIIINGS